MPSPFKPADLSRYADAMARASVSIRRGDDLIVIAEPPHRDFAVVLAEVAFHAGARSAEVVYVDPRIRAARLKHARQKWLGYVTTWNAKRLRDMTLPSTVTLFITGDSDLDAQAGIDPAADQLVCRSADGMTIGAPAKTVLDGRDALLAVGMNGEPLPIEHGFPVRMVVPGLYGYCSACKWLVDIEATTFGRYNAYWVERGWAQVAEIRTESRIDTPRGDSTVAAGTVAVAGVAWAQHRGISAVEVAVDGGGWQQATLADQPSADAWRLWHYRWDATAGKHTLAVRATDGTGAVQTATMVDPFPAGATGYHTVQVTVR